MPIVRNLAEELQVDGYLVPKGWKPSHYPAGQFSKVEGDVGGVPPKPPGGQRGPVR